MKLKASLIFIIFIGGFFIFSLTPLFGSGYEFEGVGTREVARAGAAVASADNWTAVYWNPGNIVRAVKGNKKQIGLQFFGGGLNGTDSNSISGLPGVAGAFSRQHISSNYFLGALGILAPLGEKWGFGFGFYTPLLQGTEFSDFSSGSGTTIDYESQAGILVWNLSTSVELSDQLAAGVGLNILYGKFSIENKLSNPILTSTGELEGDGTALEGIFGLRFDPHPQLSLGAVYRTGGNADIKGDAKATRTGLTNEATTFTTELRHPPTLGLGIAYRPLPKWTVELDFNQTFWTRFTNAIQYENQGLLLTNSGNSFNWKDTWKLRLGTEVALTEKTDIMGGIAYDRGKAVDPGNVDITTTLDVSRISYAAGAAHKWNERWEFLLGSIVGGGDRTENNTNYKLWGWQFMGEVQFNF
ncbi:hypothetical protein BVX98_01615 [bacterium F11]|nr:hypothetical protein BVX98_01615 [bacterium F11]